MDFQTLTIKKARELLDSGEITSVELVTACLEKISKHADLNVFLEVFEDAIKQAEEADKKIKAGEKGVLLGIPLAIKDNILIEGRRAGSASKILEGYVAPYDATAIKKLKEAGAIFIGRANMDEFAMGTSTENSAYGPTKNPHDPTRVPGGSSGGSAAAVAMNGALGALGSDTGGSVRQPSAFCGVVGFKPTYGSISRYGLMALASSLDIIGQIGKTVSDVEIIFNVLKGTDPLDSTSYYPEVKPLDSRGLTSERKIGVIKGLMNTEGIDPAIKENYDHIISKFKHAGYEIVELEIPYFHLSLAAYYIILPAEASSNLSKYDGVKYGYLKKGETLLNDYLETRGEGFGKEVRRRIILGTYVLSSGYHDQYYNKANKVRKMIKQDFDKAFKKVDAVLVPTTPSPAFKIGEKVNDPLAMYLADIFTVSANLTKGPAISIPSGTTKIGGKSLPLGIQLMADRYGEDILFELGKVMEKIR